MCLGVYGEIEVVALQLRSSRLIGCPQELSKCIDSKHREYLPLGITEVLSTMDFILNGLNVCILGSSDSGKSYLAKSLGIRACWLIPDLSDTQ